MGLELRVESGPYDEERAAAYARELLMPTDCFTALAALPDLYLGSCFGVPAEQVPARRAELALALAPGRRLPPRLSRGRTTSQYVYTRRKECR